VDHFRLAVAGRNAEGGHDRGRGEEKSKSLHVAPFAGAPAQVKKNFRLMPGL
jgi:hypothetical protein